MMDNPQNRTCQESVVEGSCPDCIQQVFKARSSQYHLGGLYYRGIGHLNTFSWMIKDVCWLKAARPAVMAFWGNISVGIAILDWISDVYSPIKTHFRLKRPLRSTMTQKFTLSKLLEGFEDFKSSLTTLAVVMWLIGGRIWSTEESKDLHANCDFGEVYEAGAAHGLIYMLVGTAVLDFLWSANIAIESLGLSTRAYYRRLHRTAASLALRGQRVPFHLPKLDDHNVVCACSKSIEACSGYLPAPRDLSTIESFPDDGKDGESSIIRTEFDAGQLSGLPYRSWGVVCVPAGCPHFETGEIVDYKRFVLTGTSYLSFYDTDSLMELFWIWKEVLASYQDTHLLPFFILSAMGALYSILITLYTMIKYRKSARVPWIDIIFQAALLPWICGNIIWCLCEMALTHTEFEFDLLRQCQQVILETGQNIMLGTLAPPLMTLPSEVPPGVWRLKHVGALLSVFSVLMILFPVLILGILDIRSYFRQENTERSSEVTLAVEED